MSSMDISNLPNHILQLIFCELPITTLLQDCRYVCKTWKCTIEDPDFAKLYQQLNELVLCNYQARRSFFRTEKETCWLAFRGKSCSNYPATMFNKLYGEFSFKKKVLVSSCNGLLCLYEIPFSHESPNDDCLGIRITNPITGEYISLPSPLPVEHVKERFCALGFSSRTNQYKVFVHDRLRIERRISLRVYVLGIHTWRNIDVPKDGFDYKDGREIPYSNAFSFVRGSCHWLVRGMRAIHAFDFEIEQFKTFKLPSSFPHHNGYYLSYIGALGDSLYLGCYNYAGSQTCTEIWVLEEYGVMESWTKKLVIEYRLCNVRKFLQHGDILLSSYNKFYSYNPDSKSFEKLDIDGAEMVSDASGHTPIFTSLKDVVGDIALGF